MKILLVGDQHHKMELPYASMFEDGRRGEWYSVIEKIHETAKECDEIVLMGDNLNTRHNHSTVIKEFINFLKGFGNKRVHVLVGNHEIYGLSSALDFLRDIDHSLWRVYTEMTSVELDGIKATFLPYLTPAMLEVKNAKVGSKKAVNNLPEGDILFAHQGITGAKVHGSMVDLFNEIVLSKTTVEKKFKKIFSGHIHNSQKLSDKTLMTGSIFTAEVGEHSKSIWILDTEDLSVEQVKLPVRGIYKIKNFTKAMSVPDEIPEDSIVKIIVTDPSLKGMVKEQVAKVFGDKYHTIIIEKYPNERKKTHFTKGGIDFSIDNLIKVFAKSKKMAYSDIKEGLRLLD